ncbi:MAG: hypothetical protein EXS10_06175 [Phycisphaerales bacterium]|nr:hypothetical protein [Phycisphaerales bacterium]
MRNTFSNAFTLPIAALFLSSFALYGCDGAASNPAPSDAAHEGHDHEGHKHDAQTPDAQTAPAQTTDDHGATTVLGEQTSGGFTVRASRDGVVIEGAEAAIDVWITGGTTKVSSVRFWIGEESGAGSVKAKAELEADNWHTHAEVPKPLAAGSKLWIEIHDDANVKSVVGFDLKQ